MAALDHGARPGQAEVISPRLADFLGEVLAGRAPNAGRFCGNCYHPLAPDRDACPHCETRTGERAPTEKVPLEVIEAHRLRLSRERLMVQAFAWGGLTVGVALALVPLAFAGVQWWTIGLFFGLLAFFYLFSANLANTLGDSLGYAWGRATFRRRWDRFVAQRDG